MLSIYGFSKKNVGLSFPSCSLTKYPACGCETLQGDSIYCSTQEQQLMLDKLQLEPDKIPTPTRYEIMTMFSKSWAKAMSSINLPRAFKENGITLKFDGSEEHLLNTTLRYLSMKQPKHEYYLKLHKTHFKVLVRIRRHCVTKLHFICNFIIFNSIILFSKQRWRSCKNCLFS